MRHRLVSPPSNLALTNQRRFHFGEDVKPRWKGGLLDDLERLPRALAMHIFTNQFVADIVGANKLSWRTIGDWLLGLGALNRDAILPGALRDGRTYVNVMNAIEPGLVRLSEKELKSPALVYAALKHAMHRLNVHACGQNIADCIHWSVGPEWTQKDHLHFCQLLHMISGQRTLADVGSDDENYVRLQDLVEVRRADACFLKQMLALCEREQAMLLQRGPRGVCATSSVRHRSTTVRSLSSSRHPARNVATCTIA